MREEAEQHSGTISARTSKTAESPIPRSRHLVPDEHGRPHALIPTGKGQRGGAAPRLSSMDVSSESQTRVKHLKKKPGAGAVLAPLGGGGGVASAASAAGAGASPAAVPMVSPSAAATTAKAQKKKKKKKKKKNNRQAAPQTQTPQQPVATVSRGSMRFDLDVNAGSGPNVTGSFHIGGAEGAGAGSISASSTSGTSQSKTQAVVQPAAHDGKSTHDDESRAGSNTPEGPQ
jgi:hypothetical protein